MVITSVVLVCATIVGGEMWIRDESTQQNSRRVNGRGNTAKVKKLPSGSALASFSGARPKQSIATDVQNKMESIPTRHTQFPTENRVRVQKSLVNAATSSAVSEQIAISIPDTEPGKCVR